MRAPRQLIEEMAAAFTIRISKNRENNKGFVETCRMTGILQNIAGTEVCPAGQPQLTRKRAGQHVRQLEALLLDQSIFL